MKFSVVIPAHNEERFIKDCLVSVRTSEANLSSPVEIVVCLNRCTDGTETIAKQFGAVLVKEDARNLAKIRNSGVRAATGDVIVTIDADSRMSTNMLCEIQRLLSTQKFIGGGTRIKPERLSLGIIASSLVILYYALRFGLRSAGLFWCLKKDFDSIGGFNESLVTLEDLDFANRLAAFGKTKRLKHGTTWNAFITTSCRKFDKYGDWYFFKNPGLVKNLFSGLNQKAADEFYYDPGR
jgi:glycosyltransferase involved in cell wall biosynthesis